MKEKIDRWLFFLLLESSSTLRRATGSLSIAMGFTPVLMTPPPGMYAGIWMRGRDVRTWMFKLGHGRNLANVLNEQKPRTHHLPTTPTRTGDRK